MLLFATVILIVLGTSSIAWSQAVWGEVGTSTLTKASGFEMNYKWAPVEGWFGAGAADGLAVGGYMQTRWHGTDYGAGDRYLPLVLGSDVFDQGRYFSARGLFVHQQSESSEWTTFVGATTGETSYSFLRAFRTEDPVGGTIFRHKFSDRLSFASYDFLQSSLTSLQSLNYKASSRLSMGITAGVGNGSGYFSVGGKYTYKFVQLTSGYTFAGNNFARVAGVTSLAAEHVGANTRLLVAPWKRLQFQAAHEDLLSPVLNQNTIPVRVTLDSLGTYGTLEKFRLGGSVSQSSAGALNTSTQSLSASRSITSSVSGSYNLMHYESSGSTSTLMVGTIQEKISPRLNVYQGISHTPSQNNLVWGVRVFTNRASIGVENNTYYSPLAGGFSGKQYTQAWTVHLDLGLFRGIRLHGDTFLDPTGHTRYSTWADGLAFARSGDESALPGAAPVSIGSYVVQGRVQDVDGKPLWGIAVQVDGQMTYSDSSGLFFLHFRHEETDPVAVLLDRSLNNTRFEVVEAPTTATAQPEKEATPLVIILRSLTVPKVAK